jgi:hypothetical protein
VITREYLLLYVFAVLSTVFGILLGGKGEVVGGVWSFIGLSRSGFGIFGTLSVHTC